MYSSILKIKNNFHKKRYLSAFSNAPKPPKLPNQYGLLIVIIFSCSLIRDYRK